MHPGDPAAQRQGVIALIRLAGAPRRHTGPFDFGAVCSRMPPPVPLFLQRKFTGTFLLCERVRDRMHLAAVFGAERRAAHSARRAPVEHVIDLLAEHLGDFHGEFERRGVAGGFGWADAPEAWRSTAKGGA